MDDQLSARAGANVGPVPMGFELTVMTAKKVSNIPLTKIDPVQKDYVVCTGKAGNTLRGQYFGITIANPQGSGDDLDTVELVYIDADNNECLLGSGSCSQGSVNSISASAFLVPVPPGAKIVARITPGGSYTGGAYIFAGVTLDMLESSNFFTEQDLGTDKRTVIPAIPGKIAAPFASSMILNMDDIDHHIDTFINDGTTDVKVQGNAATITAGRIGFVDVQGFNLLPLSEGYSLKLQMQEAMSTKRCFFIGIMIVTDTAADEPVISAP